MRNRSLVGYVSRKAHTVSLQSCAFDLAYVSGVGGSSSASVVSVRDGSVSTSLPSLSSIREPMLGDHVLVAKVEGSANMRYVFGPSPYTVPTSVTVSEYTVGA